MINSDFHIHSYYSGDSDAKMEDMINSAINLNLKTICFTDHMDYDYPQMERNPKDIFEFDVKKYSDELNYLKEKYKSKIKILIGIELGLMPYLVDRYKKLILENKFDFIIGSSHLIDGVDPYFKEFWQNNDEKTGYSKYFLSIIENIKAGHDFDTYGHIDYIVRYGQNKNLNYSYDIYSDYFDEIFKLLIEKNKALEINSAGYKYGLGYAHPQTDVLKRYKEMGGELITIGSDAHKPEHIAYDFKKTEEMLKSLGFKYYSTFENRKPIVNKFS